MHESEAALCVRMLVRALARQIMEQVMAVTIHPRRRPAQHTFFHHLPHPWVNLGKTPLIPYEFAPFRPQRFFHISA